MRTTHTLVGITMALGIALLGGNAQAANASPFVGSWESTDTDGSNQTLDINGGGAGNFAMSLYDDAASVACAGAPARASGHGVADGDDLVMTAALTCMPGGSVVRGRLALDFHYDSSTDTLTDFSGVVWHRS